MGSLLHDGHQVGHGGGGPGVQSPEDKFEACGGFTDIIHNVIFYFSWNVPDFHLVENTARKKLYENYSELNLTQIIKSGGEAIKKISNISSIADAAEQVIEDAAEILKIIPEKNNSQDSSFNYYYHVDEKIF